MHLRVQLNSFLIRRPTSFIFWRLTPDYRLNTGLPRRFLELIWWRGGFCRPQSNKHIEGQKPKGHAIQLRIYAEDPGKNFQPSSGLLTNVIFPEGIRVDTWV